jgi:hypothetical protein
MDVEKSIKPVKCDESVIDVVKAEIQDLRRLLFIASFSTSLLHSPV